MYLVGLCKLGTTCLNFEQQRCTISVYTAASATVLKCLPRWFWGEGGVEFAWSCLSNHRFTDHLLFETGFLLHQGVILKSSFYCTWTLFLVVARPKLEDFDTLLLSGMYECAFLIACLFFQCNEQNKNESWMANVNKERLPRFGEFRYATVTWTGDKVTSKRLLFLNQFEIKRRKRFTTAAVRVSPRHGRAGAAGRADRASALPLLAPIVQSFPNP